MLLPITLTIAAACAAINLWLALRISAGRVKGKVMIGDGDNGQLQAGTRAHANFVEYAPFVLILVAGIELAGGSPTWLWVLGAVFVVARVAHPLGMHRPAPNPFRAGGALLDVAGARDPRRLGAVAGLCRHDPPHDRDGPGGGPSRLISPVFLRVPACAGTQGYGRRLWLWVSACAGTPQLTPTARGR